ncbi:transcription factor MYC2 [Cryptomeria japonica]|uniref:transcription factor MYC2 n=1 Tax=Cryptomeria japonica TaxID=3369 RepID=UPI0027DAAF43|nr:transcription factor MYC2 [Cryptomeria japonica]
MGSNSILYNLMEESISDSVTTESLWNEEYVTHEISTAMEEMYTCSSQAMGNPQLSSFSLQLQQQLFDNMLAVQNTFRVSSAFTRYKKESANGFQLSQKSSMKQKSIKRCINFFRRIQANEIEKSRWVVRVDESYASTHRMAERNRRIKLTQQFYALRSLLPHNPKKCDKHSILSNAIAQLNEQKLRIAELEQHNKTLMKEVTRHICEGYSSLSDGNVEDLGKHPLMASICEEAVMVIEDSEISDEATLHVTLKNVISNSMYMDAIVTLVKCLKEMRLGVARIQCQELDSRNPVIEVAIQRQTTGGGWELFQRKHLEEMVKCALNAA